MVEDFVVAGAGVVVVVVDEDAVVAIAFIIVPRFELL